VSVDHYENFPVASWLCPPPLRPAVKAIYWFARTADDIADEGAATPDARLADLAAYRRELSAAMAGRPAGDRWRHVFEPLRAVLSGHRLDPQLLHDLLTAFERDVPNPLHADRDSLLDYCRHSANPVGRLLLQLHGLDDEDRRRRSDRVCTALQLINFWQDIGRDAARGRCYVPLADARRAGVDLADLRPGADTSATRGLLRGLCDWSESLMREGAPLALQMPGRVGWELRLVVQGGLRILERIRHMDHATLSHRPALRGLDAPLLLWRAAAMGMAR
jgi:squalene synthase HpnC